MTTRLAVRIGLSSFGLTTCGALAVLAWDAGLWASLCGTLLIAVWITVALWRDRVRGRAALSGRFAAQGAEALAHGLLLDAVPTPMLSIQGAAARAINRAARQLFATDDRVLPVPAALLDGNDRVLRHEGRRWRMDRVSLGSDGSDQLIALVDIEREERTAEARAASDLIQVLGHELLNGLAPIASLAESGVAAVKASVIDTALVSDILGTIARQSEGLQRFAEAYRALARLPAPRLKPVTIGDVIADIQRLFIGRWPTVELRLKVADGPAWPVDRDQLVQALWVLLQNAAEAALAGPEFPRLVELMAEYADGRLVLLVRDTGIGPEPGSHEQIFRPFFTTKPEGTGIGLSLARQIVYGHGGSLILETARPTTFQIRIPRNT